MSKKPQRPPASDADPAPGGAQSVDRALSLLALLGCSRDPLTLGVLASDSGLYKSTVLRLLASLRHAGLVVQHDDGRYALGPAIARWHTAYVRSFALDSVVMPELRRLTATTGESSAFHIKQARQRVCLFRVDSDHPVRDHTRAGDVMPLARGAGGRVLMAFGGARGRVYERIRRERVAVLVGDRVAELAGISSPTFDAGGRVVGAVTLTMPSDRMSTDHTPAVIDAARRITVRLGGDFPAAAAAA